MKNSVPNKSSRHTGALKMANARHHLFLESESVHQPLGFAFSKFLAAPPRLQALFAGIHKDCILEVDFPGKPTKLEKHEMAFG